MLPNRARLFVRQRHQVIWPTDFLLFFHERSCSQRLRLCAWLVFATYILLLTLNTFLSINAHPSRARLFLAHSRRPEKFLLAEIFVQRSGNRAYNDFIRDTVARLDYRVRIQWYNADFVPLGFETLGSLGPEVTALLQKIVKKQFFCHWRKEKFSVFTSACFSRDSTG